MPFVYPKETPPDLFVYQSHHSRNAYRRSFVAADIWRALTERFTPRELREFAANGFLEHSPPHEVFRAAIDLPPYHPEMNWLKPTPDHVGVYFKLFVDTFLPVFAKDLEEVKPETPGDGSDVSVSPFISPSPDVATHVAPVEQPKRGRGRPRKHPVANDS